jgi:hypothetical protein
MAFEFPLFGLDKKATFYMHKSLALMGAASFWAGVPPKRYSVQQETAPEN